MGAGPVRRRSPETVHDQLGQQLATLLPALGQAVAEIRQAKQAWLTHWEQSAVHVASAIARRLVRRELSRSPEITLTLVREALELAAGSSHVRLHFNPADHEALRPRSTPCCTSWPGWGPPKSPPIRRSPPAAAASKPASA